MLATRNAGATPGTASRELRHASPGKSQTKKSSKDDRYQA
jgi:hypothetical protein